MWRDHVLKWVRYLVGVKELDCRIKALQPLIGMRHFANGISHLSQWSGREDRELQRILIVAIAGSPRIDVNTMRCLRAFHDFLYLAQYRSHTTTTLGYLEQSFTVFHQLKKIFIQNKARRGKRGASSGISVFQKWQVFKCTRTTFHVWEPRSSSQRKSLKLAIRLWQRHHTGQRIVATFSLKCVRI